MDKEEEEAECLYCKNLFSMDTRGESWIKCNTCFRWCHKECASVDKLVLIQDDNLPPLVWSLGCIVDVHPGDDGRKGRVQTLRSSFNIVTNCAIMFRVLVIS